MRRPIPVTGLADRLRALEAPQVFGEALGFRRNRIRKPAQHVAQKDFALGADQPIRQPDRLDQKKSVKTAGRRPVINRLEAVERRHDVE